MKGDWRPLRITAQMATPFAVFRPFLLDGPLIAAAVEAWYEERGEESDPGSRRDWVAGQHVLPLRVLGGGRGWFSCCSDAEYLAVTRDNQHYTRRFDLDDAVDLLDRDRTVMLNGGRYKQHYKGHFTEVASAITWHVLGDARAIARLLPRVRGLGSRRNVGAGQVRRWDIEDDERDYSLRTREGRLARPLAMECQLISQVEVARTAMLTLHPPYWSAESRTLCAVEGTWRTP